MKTAMSIPDKIFYDSDNFAKQFHLSRSELYSKAVSEYIENHKKENITTLLDQVYSKEENKSEIDPDILELQSKSIADDRW